MILQVHRPSDVEQAAGTTHGSPRDPSIPAGSAAWSPILEDALYLNPLRDYGERLVGSPAGRSGKVRSTGAARPAA